MTEYIVYAILFFCSCLSGCREEAPAVPQSWQEAYFEMIEGQEVSDSLSVYLIDVNFDAVPEMFFVWQAANGNASIMNGFSYQDGEIVNMGFGEWLLPASFACYQKKASGESDWIVMGDYNMGLAVHEYVWYRLDFSDFRQVERESFFGYTESYDAEGVVTCTDADGNPVSMDVLMAQKQALFSGYEPVETASVRSDMGALQNREAFWNLITEYEAKCQKTVK